MVGRLTKSGGGTIDRPRYSTRPPPPAERGLANRLRFEELLAELSARLIDVCPEAIDDALRGALRAIGDHTRVDRCLLMQLGDDLLHARCTHEWLADGIAPYRMSAGEEAQWEPFTWAADRILRNELLFAESVRELPDRAELEQAGVRSVAAVPLSTGGCVLGALVFHAVRHEHVWSEALLARWKLLSAIFSNTLHRQRSERSLVERLRFEELFTALSARFICAHADAIDGVIVEALQQIAEAQGFGRASVTMLSRDGTELCVTHAWCADGVAAVPLPLPPEGAARILRQMPRDRGSILFPGNLPEGLRTLSEEACVEATIGIPITMAGEPVGALTFHVMHGRGHASEHFVSRLGLVVDVIATALARRDAARGSRAREMEEGSPREEKPLEQDVSGRSSGARRVMAAVMAVAPTDATVLIRGESGVGKELVARTIHEQSRRASCPLVKVNCAAVPRELFESEFFGHVRGAFTGAVRDRVGRFELADGGTLFLDEVGEIPLELQAKLLRVLQEGELERVGDDRTRRVDVRVVAATNRDLEREVEHGRFRRDLYYRLSVFPVDVPPLRERREDIVPLAEHFLRLRGRALGRPELRLTDAHREALVGRAWPGNVRELQNVIERAVILSPHPPLRLETALSSARASRSESPAARPGSGESILTVSEMRAWERENLVTALERTAWRISGPGGAAELLGMKPSTLRDRMKALSIRRE